MTPHEKMVEEVVMNELARDMDEAEFLEELWGVRLRALKREAEKEERKKHGRND